MHKNLVFVYGSLRRGNAGAMSARFPDAIYVADAEVCGRLYDLGAYPGLLPDNSSSRVTGEMYEVDDETLQKLDQFELTSDYIRKELEAEHGGGRTRCWVYVPDQDADFFSDRELIESGNWIEHVRARREDS